MRTFNPSITRLAYEMLRPPFLNGCSGCEERVGRKSAWVKGIPVPSLPRRGGVCLEYFVSSLSRPLSIIIPRPSIPPPPASVQGYAETHRRKQDSSPQLYLYTSTRITREIDPRLRVDPSSCDLPDTDGVPHFVQNEAFELAIRFQLADVVYVKVHEPRIADSSAFIPNRRHTSETEKVKLAVSGTVNVQQRSGDQ